MNPVLLDTNAYSQYNLGDKKVKKALEISEIIYFPTVAIGELYAGFLNGSLFEKNRAILMNFISDPKVELAEVQIKTALIYGNMYSELKKSGTPVSSNDIWIAACAIETGSTIVTYDKHFLKIPGVKVWKSLH